MSSSKPHPSRSRQPTWRELKGDPNATLQYAWALMQPWPKSWAGVEADLAYGESLLEEFKPFVRHLIEAEKLTPSTVRRHLNNLWLLGGELIGHINIHKNDRRLPAARLLDNKLFEDGGPLCKHVQEGTDQQQYDATCKKFFSFRSASRGHLRR